MEESRERVISVSLNEADWQAFIRLHPQPVLWLREQIRAEAGVKEQASKQTQTAA